MVGTISEMLLLAFGRICWRRVREHRQPLLAQAHGRTLEFGIRGAVGASPGRLARQLWTETLALFAIAGTLGVALAHPLALWLVSCYPETLPLAADVAIDGRVLAIATACTLAAALLAGFPRTRVSGTRGRRGIAATRGTAQRWTVG